MFTVPPHMEWGVTRPPPHPPSPKPLASPTTSTGEGYIDICTNCIHILYILYTLAVAHTHTTYVYTHVYIYIYVCIINLHTHIVTIIISGGRGDHQTPGHTYSLIQNVFKSWWIILYIYNLYIYIRRYHVLQQKQQCSTISQVIFKLPLTPCHQCWSCLNWNC